LPDLREFDTYTTSKFERDVVGIYLSGHPLEQYSALMEDCNFNTSKIHKRSEDDEAEAEAELEFGNNSPVNMAAVVVEYKKMLTKATKQEMAVMKVEDIFGTCEVMLFPKVLEKAKPILTKDAIVRITGKLSIREGEDAIVLADNIELLQAATTESAADKSGVKTLYLKYNTADASLHSEVLRVLEAYSGTLPVVIKCLAKNSAVSLPRTQVRECQSIVWELQSLLDAGSVVFR